ncbi:MAG: histidine phosphatase family protein [Methylococcales bacterium]|nr:histidine phosphatase family protein [Methylococcales bacterium]
MPTTIDFLRHGEVAGGSYYRGSTDDLLTKLGWQQMNNAVANQSWDHIISSPLHRCLDFTQDINSKTNIPFNIEPNWQEINFGDWEGKTANQINPDELTLFYRDPVNNPPLNAENFSVFLSRVEQAWESLIKNHRDQHILVITHAGVIRSLFTLLLNLPIANIFNLQVDHASITRFQCFDGNPDNFVKLISHNLAYPQL